MTGAARRAAGHVLLRRKAAIDRDQDVELGGCQLRQEARLWAAADHLRAKSGLPLPPARAVTRGRQENLAFRRPRERV